MNGRSMRRRGDRRARGLAIVVGLGSMLVGPVVAHAGTTGPAPIEGLVAGPSRVLPLSTTLARGRVEQRTLALDGLPLRGAWELVRTRPDGTRTVVAARYPDVGPQLRPSEARISPAAVPGLIASARGQAQEPELEGPPELVYLLVLGQPVLAWETQLALVMRPEPSRLTVWVSAATGRVLREQDQVWASRARIFPENPSKTPEPIEVTLRDLDLTGLGHPLRGPRVQAFNCLDEPSGEVSPWWSEDECYPQQTVFSDAQGDFFVPLPDVIDVWDNVDATDPYAELSMYVHGEIFLDAMRERGVEQFQCELSSMLANVRTLEPSATAEYAPLNNAYYTNQCDPERGPTMMFGQGSDVDFAYDADVIYHELGHGMVALLTPEGLGARRKRVDGSLVDAAAINEAVADYFTVMLTDDPQLAEYVGRFWTAQSRPYIRDAENDKTCPGSMVGESHTDGEPLMAALWATRKRLEPDGKDALDRVLMEALLELPSDATLEEMAALLVEGAQRAVADEVLTADDVDLLRRSLDARGLFDCPRVITDPEAVRAGRTMHLRRVEASVHPFHPGPMQLRYVVPPDAHDMVVELVLKPRGSTDPVEGAVLVKRGDQPIAFDYQLVQVDDPPLDPPEDEDPGDPVRELVLVSGDWDSQQPLEELSENSYQLVLGGLEPGEVLHVALVNVSPTDATATNVRIHASTALPEGETDTDDGAPESDESGEPAAFDEIATASGEAGCACRLRPERGRDPGLVWLAAMTWAAARGRRRRRSR